MRSEDIGIDHINELFDHGFLEKGQKENGHTYYSVHEDIHELAVMTGSEECMCINSISALSSVQVVAVVSHLSIIVIHTDVKDYTKTFENCKDGMRVLRKKN